MRRAALVTGILTLLLWGNGAPARAEFIFDNFTLANGFNTGPGHNINIDSSPNIRRDLAMPFVPTATRSAESIRFAASIIPESPANPNPSTLQAYITTTAVGGVPSGLPISEVLTFTNVPNTPTILAATFTAGNPVLLAATQYWLVVRTDPTVANPPLAQWHLNTTGSTGSYGESPDGLTWSLVPGQTLGAFSVLAVVPEPSSFVLAGLGMCSLCGVAWRRRKQPATEAVGQ